MIPIQNHWAKDLQGDSSQPLSAIEHPLCNPYIYIGIYRYGYIYIYTYIYIYIYIYIHVSIYIYMCNVIIYMMIFHHLPSYKAPFWREHIPPGWSRDRPGCAASYYGWHPGGSIGEKLGNWSILVVYEKSGMKLSLRRASFFFRSSKCSFH
jgi:hypothetical protein